MRNNSRNVAKLTQPAESAVGCGKVGETSTLGFTIQLIEIPLSVAKDLVHSPPPAGNARSPA